MTVWMLAALGASTVFAIAAFIGDRLAARFGLPRRFVWVAAAVLAATFPVASGLRATPAPSIRPAVDRVRPFSMVERGDGQGAGALERVRGAAVGLQRAAQGASRLDGWLIDAWVVLSSAMLLRLLLAMAAVRHAARDWQEAWEPIGRVFVARDCGPAVTGVLRPRIVVPRWLLDEDSETRALLLHHEVEHVRAGDTRLILAAALVDVLLPWNLALRWMSQRLRVAIEIDCDARVVATVGDPRRYGLALLAVSERFAAPLPLAAALLSASTGIEERIGAMTTQCARRSWRGGLSLGAVAAFTTLLCACVQWPVLPPRASPGAPSMRSPDANAQATLKGMLAMKDTRAVVARDSAERQAMSREMDEIRGWMALHHPDVASRVGVNGVTFVVDSGGHYLSSAAEALSHDELVDRIGPSLLPDETEPATMRPPAPSARNVEPWIGLGIRSAQIHHMTIIQARAGVWAPGRFFITVLHLRNGAS